MLLVALVLSVVAPVYFNDTVHRMWKLWFRGSCLCPEGCYYSGHIRSLSIDPIQRRWLGAVFVISVQICFLFFHVECCVTFVQISHLDGRFKYSVLHLRWLVSSLSWSKYGPHGNNLIIISIWRMVNARCTHLDLGEDPKAIVSWQLFGIFWVSLQLALECWGALPQN